MEEAIKCNRYNKYIITWKRNLKEKVFQFWAFSRFLYRLPGCFNQVTFYWSPLLFKLFDGPEYRSSIWISMNVTLIPATANGYSQVALFPSHLNNNLWKEAFILNFYLISNSNYAFYRLCIFKHHQYHWDINSYKSSEKGEKAIPDKSWRKTANSPTK